MFRLNLFWLLSSVKHHLDLITHSLTSKLNHSLFRRMCCCWTPRVSEVWWCFGSLQSFCRWAWPLTSINLNMTSRLNEALSGNQSVSEISPEDKLVSFVYDVRESLIQDERGSVRMRHLSFWRPSGEANTSWTGRSEGCWGLLAHMQTDMPKHTRNGHPGRERAREREREMETWAVFITEVWIIG